MADKALLVRVEAKPGKEADVEQFLKDALPQRADELFAEPPSIEPLDVLVEKLPG